MTWEWEHGSAGGRWVMTSGSWQAVVQRLAGPRIVWQATLTHKTAPQEHFTSPTYADAVNARTWCLGKIAELMGKTT